MTSRLPLDASPASLFSHRRTHALSTAIVLRDCSFRAQTMTPERRACRTLMREAAITWHHGTMAGQWE